MMRNYRQAALCLHGLGRDDRQWLLSRLPDQHQAALRSLLDELESLGIPGDSDPREYTRQTGDPADDLLEIESASPEQVWNILEGECDAVVRVLLAARDWSWKSGMVARFRKSYRNIAAPEQAPGARVQEALIKAFAARLRGQQLKPASSQKTPWNKRLRRMLWQR